MITETTSSWYKINKEWNYLDLAVADYNFTAIPSASPHDLNIPLVAGGSTMEYYQDNGAMNKKIQKAKYDSGIGSSPQLRQCPTRYTQWSQGISWYTVGGVE